MKLSDLKEISDILDYSFNDDVDIYVEYIANTDTPYVVEHYLEKLVDDPRGALFLLEQNITSIKTNDTILYFFKTIFYSLVFNTLNKQML